MSALSPRSGIQVSSVYPTYTHIKGQSPVCVWPSQSQSSHADSRVFFAFLSFAESFVVEQQTLFGVDLIHISMISGFKVQC